MVRAGQTSHDLVKTTLQEFRGNNLLGVVRYMVPSMAYLMALVAVVLEMVCSRLSLARHSPTRRSWQETP